MNQEYPLLCSKYLYCVISCPLCIMLIVYTVLSVMDPENLGVATST